MTDFVVNLNITWLKAISCNGRIIKDKQSLNVWHGIFYHIFIKDKL
jgi:hypothetical protein